MTGFQGMPYFSVLIFTSDFTLWSLQQLLWDFSRMSVRCPKPPLLFNLYRDFVVGAAYSEIMKIYPGAGFRLEYCIPSDVSPSELHYKIPPSGQTTWSYLWTQQKNLWKIESLLGAQGIPAWYPSAPYPPAGCRFVDASFYNVFKTATLRISSIQSSQLSG